MTKKEENFRKLRNEIDSIDDQLIKLLSKRFKIIKEISKLKKSLNLPIQDRKREVNALIKSKNKALKLKLNGRFITVFFRNLFEESKIVQNKEIQSSRFDKKAKK